MFQSKIVFKTNYPCTEQKLVLTEGKLFSHREKRNSLQKSIFVATMNNYSKISSLLVAKITSWKNQFLLFVDKPV